MDHYDAILIPGGGVKDKGELPSWVKSRLNHAIKTHHARYIITLSGGTVHKPPPLDENGFPIFESIAAAQYLINHGIDPDTILPEISSYDTIGNAYFSRVIHAEPAGLRKLLIITSEFHIIRARAIFEWMYSLDDDNGKYQLAFDAVPDTDVGKDDLQARTEREAASLKQFLKIKGTIHSLQDCHQWLFTAHAAYSLSLTAVRATGKSLNTY